jgi:hypothetical protein
MYVDGFHQFLASPCDKGRGDGWCRCLPRDVDAFKEFQQPAPLHCNVNVAQAKWRGRDEFAYNLPY